MKTPWSPICERIGRPRDVRGQRAKVWGVLWHTTGRGILVRSGGRIDSDASLSKALGYYATPGNAFAHYLIGHGGERVQIASDAEMAWQAAWTDDERNLYHRVHNGEARPLWLAWWNRRWPGECCPFGLLNGLPPNQVYVGVETLWHPGGITDAQYDSCARLGADLLTRHRLTVVPGDFDACDDCRAPAWCGHEDVCPATRTDRRGRPWDPGTQIDFARLWRETRGYL